MNFYERMFGSGPRGASLAIMLLILAYYLEDTVGLDAVFANDIIRYSLFIIFSMVGVIIIVWSLASLPPKRRGVKLVTNGAYRYFRHPLYAAFLLFLNVGVAILLNNWVYFIWAILMFPMWSVNVRSEEKLMHREFGDEYNVYCRNTWRFFPKLF